MSQLVSADELLVMLDEASSRTCPQEAAVVIAAVLQDLSSNHPDLAQLSRAWQLLAGELGRNEDILHETVPL